MWCKPYAIERESERRDEENAGGENERYRENKREADRLNQNAKMKRNWTLKTTKSGGMKR